MLTLAWPWLLLLTPLPWLIYRWLPPAEVHMAALRVPFLQAFDTLSHRGGRRASRYGVLLGVLLAWLLLMLAAARPQWVGELAQVPISGRDLLLAVDLSSSMSERDFIADEMRVDRLTATKQVAGEFIRRRAGDRIGLVLFGQQAYLQTPLTFDRRTVATLLEEAQIGLAGRSTAIGDAIGLAVKRLRREDARNRVLILLTDGANTAGQLAPLEAARIAQHAGVRIFTIGVGADEIYVQSLFGLQRVNPSAELDEDTLTQIAELTGGQYFRAHDTEALEEIYTIIDQIEPVVQEPEQYRPRADLFYWPLAGALLLATILAAGYARGRLV